MKTTTSLARPSTSTAPGSIGEEKAVQKFRESGNDLNDWNDWNVLNEKVGLKQNIE
jgi:hypothetical protein